MTKADRIRQAEADQAALVALTTLTIEQQNAVELLITGQPDGEVATAVGVTRQTICTWRNHHPAFQAALNARRREVWSATVDRLRELLPRAVERLEAELDGPNGWRIALRLLEATGAARPTGMDLGRYGIGAMDANALIEGILQARADPMAFLGQHLVSDFQRRELVAELAAKLAEAPLA
jgi:hypothetical protein